MDKGTKQKQTKSWFLSYFSSVFIGEWCSFQVSMPTASETALPPDYWNATEKNPQKPDTQLSLLAGFTILPPVKNIKIKDY